LLRAVAPALTLIMSFKLRQLDVLPPILDIDVLLIDYILIAVASVAQLLISISGL